MKKINRSQRISARKIVICCPDCECNLRVYHMEWSALICPFCHVPMDRDYFNNDGSWKIDNPIIIDNYAKETDF